LFAEHIYDNPFTNQEANEYFAGKIYSARGQSLIDSSFLSTIRALLGSRVNDGEVFKVDIAQVNGRPEQVIGDSRTKIERFVRIGEENETDTLQICGIAYKDARDWMTLLGDCFTDTFSGYVYVPKITEFFRKSFNVMCFINPEKRATRVFFDDSVNIRALHLLQCGIPAYLPWFFKNNSLTDDEKELLASLREKTSAKYNAVIERIAKQYNFREMKIRRLLEGFETIFERRERENLAERIQGIMEEINSYSEEISRLLREKRDMDARLLGYDLKIDQDGGESELMNFFLTNKALTLVSCDGSRLQFVASGKLTFFDEDMAESVINNENSMLYRPNRRDMNGVIRCEDMKKLMRAIFVDQTIALQVCAAYSITIGGGVRGMAHFGYGASFANYLPNPHIDQFQCLGNHERIINQCVINNDYIGAVSQCIASSQSLNFGDGVVMTSFAQKFYDNSPNAFLWLPNGKMATPKQAIKYLKEGENE